MSGDDKFFEYGDPEAEVEIDDGLVFVGDDINITEKHPGMHNLLFGMGWDFNTFSGDTLDLDACLFLLNKDDVTREDDDFIFYNNLMVLNGSIKHHGDSRSGAGEGDDEAISVDLHGIPFDVIRIAIVISIYQGDEKDQNLGMVRNVYLRMVHEDNKHEVLRFNISEELQDSPHTAAVIGYLDREGPKWHFRPTLELLEGGLKAYGIAKGLMIIDQ